MIRQQFVEFVIEFTEAATINYAREADHPMLLLFQPIRAERLNLASRFKLPVQRQNIERSKNVIFYPQLGT